MGLIMGKKGAGFFSEEMVREINRSKITGFFFENRLVFEYTYVYRKVLFAHHKSMQL